MVDVYGRRGLYQDMGLPADRQRAFSSDGKLGVKHVLALSSRHAVYIKDTPGLSARLAERLVS